MDIQSLGERVEVPHIDECGPAMRALNEKQRRYVCALGVFGNNKTWAYQWAYGSSNPKSSQVAGSRLGDQDKIKAAIQEHYLDKRTNVMVAVATDSLLDMMGPTNLDAKSKLKAIQLAMEAMPGFKKAVEVNLNVTHKLSLPELEEKIARLQRELNLPQLAPPVIETEALDNGSVIEAEYSEVDPDLADIL